MFTVSALRDPISLRSPKPCRAVSKFTARAWAGLLATSLAFAQIPKPTDAPTPMTPEQSAAAFKLPEGFRMEVVASEPLIASPSAVCWDERGRMFVSELHGYNLAGQLDIEELNKTGKLDTQVRRVQADEKFQRAAKAGTFGVVKLLRDTNGDGRMDAAEVWATNLPPIYGLVSARGGIIVACAPDIVFLADRDGDGKAETRAVLFTGFPTGELERGINAPQWGVDGWIYFGRGWGGGKITGSHLREAAQLPGSDFRIRADGSAIEPVTGGTHTFGFAMTEAGDRFTVNTTIPAIYIAPLPWHYLLRNPDAATPSLEIATGDRRAYAISKPHPWRQKRADDPAYFKYYNSRYGAAESEADGWFTAACGPMVYQDRTLPGLHGEYFVCEPAGNLIHRALIEQDGSALKIRRAPGEEKSEFAASNDAWSHPMNLTHGPDGCIWATDYYREIIEDYSAIPRHLQQQYGVYAGHDRGRIYRLTHRDAPRAPAADMSALETKVLARECASPFFWRRQTAQRLLVERGETNATPMLRELLAGKKMEPSPIITALRTLDQLGALTPSDVQSLINHADAAVRIHALQLADPWFAKDEGRALLDTTLTAAAAEPNPRVQIQFALSLGEARDPRAFAMLAQFAREKLAVRWMDSALLSSLHGRGLEMLGALLREPGGSAPLLPALAQSIAARRDEVELTSALNLVAMANADAQAAVLSGLVKGRENAPRKPLGDKSARAALASLAASPAAEIRSAAHALEDTFVATVADDELLVSSGQLPPVEQVSEETFRKFVAALAGRRDRSHGHEIFLQACATCHRIGNEGNEVGPDLLGQLGIAEESLLKDILMPNERIRPGYETTVTRTREGREMIGLLKSDGATSLTIVQAGGVEQVLLRKDVVGVRRLAASLMPSFAEGLRPADLADLLAWLRSNLGKGVIPAEARKVPSGESSVLPEVRLASRDVPRFEIFEQAFTQQRSYDNAYVNVTASATFVQPDGRPRSIPLFWDGGTTWKVRFSPDVIGAWTWSVSSSDPGLNGSNGSFNCIASTNHGGITAMTGHPYHLQYQDGTPYWLFGDTQWEAFADDPGQNLDARSVSDYFTIRAGQGYNYVHTEIIGLVRASQIDAKGREQPAFDDYRAQKINPTYFKEVDARLGQANSLGITLGLILMEPYFTPASSIDPAFRYDNRCWMSFPDEAARLRYARYAVARYSAFNVLFLVTLEWGPATKPIPRTECIAMFNRIGTEIEKHDPHQRLRGIHDDNGTLPDDFYSTSSGWNTLGQYCQYSGSDYGYPWCDGCTPPDDSNCRGRFATPKNRQTLHDELLDVRLNRNRNKPVINGEYAYYLRRGIPAHPMVVNRGHSHDQATFRKAAWVLSMAGTYIVPGFWRTYYGGWAGRNTPFRPQDPEALAAIKDLQTLHTFFTQVEDSSRRQWWKLVPHDDLVSSRPNPADGSPGRAYCLADPGRSYVVYTENTRSTDLPFNGSSNTSYRVTRFDPRTGKRILLDGSVSDGTTFKLLSPDSEDWVYEAKRN
jgi:putative membrane-bound dehydrogenase-like protein